MKSMEPAFVAERAGYVVSTDASRLDLAAVHDYLCNHSYWCRGIPLETLQRALENSLCFNLLHGSRQVGLARVISDRATYAYLCDVYVLEAHRGRGHGRWLIECVSRHADLQGLRRMSLVTADAHNLYAGFGFVQLAKPERHMEKLEPEIYLRNATRK
jgi:GNAT superfamily N-acetyltransferase